MSVLSCMAFCNLIIPVRVIMFCNYPSVRHELKTHNRRKILTTRLSSNHAARNVVTSRDKTLLDKATFPEIPLVPKQGLFYHRLLPPSSLSDSSEYSLPLPQQASPTYSSKTHSSKTTYLSLYPSNMVAASPALPPFLQSWSQKKHSTVTLTTPKVSKASRFPKLNRIPGVIISDRNRGHFEYISPHTLGSGSYRTFVLSVFWNKKMGKIMLFGMISIEPHKQHEIFVSNVFKLTVTFNCDLYFLEILNLLSYVWKKLVIIAYSEFIIFI